MSSRYDFKRDLRRGKAGEEMLVTLWPDIFVPPTEDVRAYDLLHVDGRTVEVKTDYYDHETTPNFFMENTSHDKPGGPWRALRDDVGLFVYLFVEPQPVAYVWEDVRALCCVLDTKFAHAPGREIHNGGWKAYGFLVDRGQLLSHTDVTVLEWFHTEDTET